MKVTTTMTTTTKTMSSPGGADKYYPPPLMRFLRSNVGSKSRGRTASSKSSPLMFINRRRSSGTNSSGLSSMEAQQEPSSPTVTCIGQIRVKRGSRSGPTRRRRCHQCTWVPSATSACRYEKMRPCCCVVVRRPSWPKWTPFSSCTKKRMSQREEEEDDEEVEEEEEKICSRTLQQVVEAKGECCFEDEEEEEEEDEEVEKRVSVYESVSPPKNALLLPPKNALLLTRCRSAPYWSSSLTYRFGGSPLDDNKEVISKFDDQEEELEEEEDEEEEEDTTTTTCPTSKRASLSKVDEEEPLMVAVKEFQRPVAVEEEEALRPVILTRCRSEPARTGAEKLDRRKEAELAEMWQVLMAAAVAGSTNLVSKRFLARGPAQPEQDEIGPQCTPPPQLRPESPDCGGADVIFRFSSSGSSSSRRKKKTKMTKNKGKRKGKGKEMSAGRGPRVTGRLVEYGGGAESACGKGRKFVVRLKRRRISKIMLSKSSSTKDDSLFSWGLGVGMVCMMSAGKTEIGKLSAAMDETSKVVNELRAELSKRKVAQVMTNRGVADFKAARLPLNEDVECPSSILMEEPEVEVLEMEMDLSEAELESELKGLPWSSDDAPNNDSGQKISLQAEASTNKFDELEEGGVAYQCHGLGQEELDKRLSHMLIEHQENQIVELESELHLAQSKLHEKEAELQALKQLTQQFSISSVSDDEDDEHERELQDFCGGWNDTCENGSESRRPVVGMKRPIISAQ